MAFLLLVLYLAIKQDEDQELRFFYERTDVILIGIELLIIFVFFHFTTYGLESARHTAAILWDDMGWIVGFIGFGLIVPFLIEFRGSTQWLKKYIDNDRMARTVEVSALFGTQVEFFTDQHIEQLRQISIEENVAPIEAAFGWNDLTLWFYTADGSIDTGLTHGRSVNVADPVLKRMTFQKKPNTFFSDKGIAQIIVSQSLLKSLNYDDNEIPSHLTIEYLNASAQVEVVGVADWTPAGDFLMTDEFNRAINDRTWNPNPRYDLAYVGPILDTTTANAQLKSIRKRLSRLKIKGQIIKRFGSEEWFEFRKPKKAAWNQQQWEELFISTIKPKFGERHEFHDPLPPEISSFDKINVGYIRASIYVKSLSDVPTVVDTLVDNGYKVTNDVKQLAQIFMQVSSFGGGILKWVVFIVGTLSVISIGLSITQTIQGKTPEIGILKAYGASNYLIFFIYMLEALLIWLLALVGGSFFIYQVADFVNESMIRIFTLQGAMLNSAKQFTSFTVRVPRFDFTPSGFKTGHERFPHSSGSSETCA
jgi:hypothetical protein